MAGDASTNSSTSDSVVVESDVVVVGAGPGGAAAAHWLARRGLTVSLLEKSTFPRDKVCGDGLTPRATKQLVRLGVDVSEEAGWVHNVGLRTYGGRDEPFEFLWPELTQFPSFGLTRPRSDLGVTLSVSDIQNNPRLGLSFDNSVALPNGTLSYALGTTQGQNGQNAVTGSLNYATALPKGTLTVGVNRSSCSYR